MFRAIFLSALLFVCSPALREGAVYYMAASILDTMARWALCAGAIAPGTTSKEFQLFSSVCRLGAERAFSQLFTPKFSCHQSWEENRRRLAQLPPPSPEEKPLLQFLERRWLAKAAGFYPVAIDWIYPCFGVCQQVHPMTTNAYARDPATSMSKTYAARAEAWKFPVLLTRSCDVSAYLPTDTDVKLVKPGVIRLKKQNPSLFRWIAERGLTATPAELDGLVCVKSEGRRVLGRPLALPQTDLFSRAVVKMLNGLSMPETLSPTMSTLVENTHKCIREKLAAPEPLFSRMEEIHAHISSLLTISQPFSVEDFASIYRHRLTHIPNSFLSCGIHSSAMASFAGILRAAELTAGKKLHVLYGENTYFECINAVERSCEARPVGTGWEDVDLIVAQFNPALKRPALSQNGFNTTRYRVEPVAETVRKALRKDKLLTVAIDCTFDSIDSVRVGQLAEEFAQEIREGFLNIVCYRSGIKFDLFGMDNYAGAPFCMLHAGAHWAAFDALLHDPVLLPDNLSVQWFCLAYQHAAAELEQYRKQIFDNTREVLRRVPESLFAPSANYRIIPVEEGADLGFIDFKVSGPCHVVRGGCVAGAYLLSECLRQGFPMFTRKSLGYYHPNFSILFGEENSTIRLTLGTDPGQVDVFVQCFIEIDKLNH